MTTAETRPRRSACHELGDSMRQHNQTGEISTPIEPLEPNTLAGIALAEWIGDAPVISGIRA